MHEGAPYANARPGSIASTITTDAPDGCDIAIIGYADDEGVSLNGGRPGAAHGPRAFRAALARYGVTSCLAGSGGLEGIRIYDAGDVTPRDTIDHTHAAVTKRVYHLLEHDVLVVGIGGGHDLTWPAVRAVAEAYPDLAGVYVDAHLDVREDVGSGMPFRRILEETSCSELSVMGLDPFTNTREHRKWFESHGGRVTEELPTTFDATNRFVSFDLDAINVSHAPGVSAINPAGLGAEEAIGLTRSFGSIPSLRYVDFMELNPAFDIDGRTARLAVRLFLELCVVFADRS